MKTKIITLAIVTCCWACLNQAQAVPIIIEITGNVTSASGSGLPGTIYAGVIFSGTYTYDSSTQDSDTDPQRGVYKHDAPYGISITLGGYEFKTAPSHVGQFDMLIMNDDPMGNLWDSYMVFSYENVSVPSLGFETTDIRWYLGDSTHSALSSSNLPVTAPVLTDWEHNDLEIYGSGFGIRGTVTQVIPEPLTGALMAMGAFFLRRRR
jgi:hypothetical protein